MATALDLPAGRKRGRGGAESKYGFDDDGNDRKSKTHRTDNRDFAGYEYTGSMMDEKYANEVELERDMKVGARGRVQAPTDDPLGQPLQPDSGLAGALSVGANIGRPFGAAQRLPIGRGPLPAAGLGAARGGMDVDPITGMFPQDRRARVVRSTGRDAPAAPQSNIVGTVIVAKNIYDQRSKVPDDDSIAPLGTEEDFRIMQGEWCFMVAEQGKANRQSVLQDTDIEVVSCVNGKSRYDRLQFVGNMQGKGSNPADPRSDDHATVMFAGVMSGIHTGLDTIPPFVPVHFREDPATIQDSTGRLVPAIAENGQPPTKFRPASYAYTEEIIGASVMRIQGYIDRLWDATMAHIPIGTPVNMNVAPVPGDGDGARQRHFWRSAQNGIDDYFRQAQWGNEDHPLKVYARWYAILLMTNMVNTSIPDIRLRTPNGTAADDTALIFGRFAEVSAAMVTAIRLQQRNKHIRDYNSVIGLPVSQLRRPDLQNLLFTNGGMIVDAQLGNLPGGAVAWTALLRRERCEHVVYPRIRQYITEYISSQMVQGTQEQHYKNRLSFGGISLKLAQAGKPLDLLKGTNF